jgi:hypothetical protein
VQNAVDANSRAARVADFILSPLFCFVGRDFQLAAFLVRRPAVSLDRQIFVEKGPNLSQTKPKKLLKNLGNHSWLEEKELRTGFDHRRWSLIIEHFNLNLPAVSPEYHCFRHSFP